MAEYTIYRAPGWHGEPSDPAVATTDDREQAALMAGERIDIHMPGGCNKFDSYATDSEGQPVEPIECYRCDACGELTPWGEGPIGTLDGAILDCPGAAEKHRVDWVCGTCADTMANA